MKRVLFLLLALVVSSAAHAQPSGDQLLREMEAAEKSVQYSGVERIVVAGSPSMTMRLFRSGLKRRLEWLEPPIMRGDVLVDDGQTVWRYVRDENAAFQTRSTARGGNMAGRLSAKVTGHETVAGRACSILTLSNKSGRAVRRLWVDQANKTRLRSEQLSARGKNAVNALQSVQFGPVDGAKFRFVPPSDAKVTRTSGALFPTLAGAKRAAAWLQSPSFVPRGFALENALVDAKKGESWLRFSDGASRFSIFQQRSLGADAAPQQVDGGWFLRRSGYRFLIVGAGTNGERIAGSIR